MPPNTPPSHLSVALLVIIKGRKIQIFITLVKKQKKIKIFGIPSLMLVHRGTKTRNQATHLF